MKVKLLLRLIFQGFLLYETLAWEVRMPKEIHGLKGSCLVIPCSFSYTSYPPTNPNRVVWYQWVSKGYPIVYDPEYPSNVIDNFKGRTALYGKPSNRDCSLVIKHLDQSHHGEKLYPWIDPDSIGWRTYKFYDVTSTILVDESPQKPTINVHGGAMTGDTITVTCETYHTCPYSKPNIILKGIEGSDKTDQTDHPKIGNGQWKITLTRTGVVKAEHSDIECIVTHYGGKTARATKSRSAKCIHTKIAIEPDRADVIEGVSKKFTCTIDHSCLKNPPTISWNYKNMEVSNSNKKLSELKSATSSTITFVSTKEHHGKMLKCTANISGKPIETSVTLHVQHSSTEPPKPAIPVQNPSRHLMICKNRGRHLMICKNRGQKMCIQNQPKRLSLNLICHHQRVNGNPALLKIMKIIILILKTSTFTATSDENASYFLNVLYTGYVKKIFPRKVNISINILFHAHYAYCHFV